MARLPSPLKTAAISAYGLKLMRSRYGRAYFRERADLMARDYSDLAAEQRRQAHMLRSFLTFAQTHSDFYRVHLADVDPQDIADPSDLAELPIVDKETLRANIESVYTVAASDSIVASTGGTTGAALQVRFTKSDFQKRMAYLDAFKMRLGIDVFRAKKATFSGRQFVDASGDGRLWQTNLAYRQRLYSTFDLTESNLPHYVKDLNRYRPEVVNGFVSAISQVAEYIERHDVPLDFRPTAVFTTSETLLPMHRNQIERVFGCRVYNQYASAEGAPFITECSAGRLHYNLDTGVIQVQGDDREGEIVVTSFTTHGTPLIRYAIGDRVRLSTATSCECGCAHPLVDEVQGRQVDYLESSERGRISLSHLADVIKGLPNNVIAMQFVQDHADAITVRMVVNSASYGPEDEASIRHELHYRFGASVQLDFDYVEEIEREASGKRRLIRRLGGAPA